VVQRRESQIGLDKFQGAPKTRPEVPTWVYPRRPERGHKALAPQDCLRKPPQPPGPHIGEVDARRL
jgi:hypothetical protein